MPLFLSPEEYDRCSHDVSLVADKADAFIRELSNQLETVRAQADAASITAEQTCSLLEQKYVSLSSEFDNLQSQHSHLNASLDQRLSELAQLQADKHQIHLQSIGKDGQIERLSMEVSELHKSKRQLIELVEQKDLEINEKNSTIKAYLDKIVNLTDSAALREARSSDLEAELARAHASCARLSQEKELIDRHNVWLNDELTDKVNSLMELRKTHSELEADLSAKLTDLEKKYNECSSSLKWKNDRVKELELKLTSMQEDLCSSKDTAAAIEERFSAELSTVTKLVELYKESSEEWSKKAGELEGVIRALETHSVQVENDYKERLEKESSARKQFEEEAAALKEKLEKCEAELESTRRENELNLLPLSHSITKTWVDSDAANDMVEDNRMLVPAIPAGVSGTALAASLIRDGWSLAKMYAKYQEAVDAFRHEQLGRKQSQAILERVLYEIEEKAAVILDERAEHERLVDAYSEVNQKLQHSTSEQATLQRTIQEFKADLRKYERDYSMAQKEIVDLQQQVTVLLKECRDIQLRCGSVGYGYADDHTTTPYGQNTESDAEKVFSERLLTFKDINGLVEQNVKLRSLVRSLSDQIENKEGELKEEFEKELQRHSEEAASKVDVVLARAEEQGRMIDSLHTSVAMYKKLYEEEHKLHSSYPRSEEAAPVEGRKDVMFLLEGSQESAKKAQDHFSARVKCLEEDLVKSRSEIISLRSDRDKLALESNFAQEKLDRFMKEYERQRDEINGVISRNVEFSQLIIDYQRKLRESSESSHASEELSRKLTMELSILKSEKEMLINSEKRVRDEVCSLSERVHRLQATLDTIQSAEEVREEARSTERKRKEEHIKQLEREWAEAKKELQEERDHVRTLTLERESTMKSAMRQVEEMGKELSKALHAVAASDARAAVAEARCSDLEKKIKSSETKVYEKDGECGPSSSIDEAIADLGTAREEIEKLREESQVNKDHMLQYKSIAQVNESALKQMEVAHENFKVEAEKVKKSLEAELLSHRERIDELETECSLKINEAASAAAGQEEAHASALSEIVSLKEESAVKLSQIVALETQFSAMKDDLEKEHQRWRTAQANYERQVILQSETIQELTKTSQALSSLQEEASELRKLSDSLKTENNELKTKWDTEKSVLEGAKNEAEKKYNEINEQNMILHSRLEAMHIKLAETDRGSGGTSSSQDPFDDAGLQNVVNYLRRSKEIAETEISLLKHEKLRLQTQLESALKAAETAQASLRAERTNSRVSLFTEEEFKSLQFQVREMNLLRESNMQLREENKHNFEECQKLREASQKARIETENLETLLRERQTEIESCKREIDIQKENRERLEKKVTELLEKSKNIDVEDYDRMAVEFQQMQVNMKEKDAQLDEMKKLVSDKLGVISQLEQDLGRSRAELNEREIRINDILQLEASLKSEVEKQKRVINQLKRKSEILSKEKEELSKENQTLSKQLEDSKQSKKSVADAASEQSVREKEKEKDTRIQMLEKIVEKLREDMKKDKDDLRTEKDRRTRIQKTIYDSFEKVTQAKRKLVDELEKHKQAVRTLSDEVDKLKHVKSNQPEGTSAVQLPGTLLDDLTAAYLLAVENFERAAPLISSEFAAPTPAGTSSSVDTSSVGAITGQAVAVTPPSLSTPVAHATSLPSAKTVEEREKIPVLPKTNVEARKVGRKLIRPRIVKPQEPKVDAEMPEIQGNLTVVPPPQPPVRKRPATPELQEESQQLVSQEGAEVPVLKKSKGSDESSSLQEGAEAQSPSHLEIPENLPSVEESADDLKEDEAVDETVGEEPKVEPLQNEAVDEEENVEEAAEVMVESESEREEGEMVSDLGDVDGNGGGGNVSGSPEIGEIQLDRMSEEPVPTTDAGDIALSPQIVEEDEDEDGDDKNDDVMEETEEGGLDKLNDQQVAPVEADQIPETAAVGGESASSPPPPPSSGGAEVVSLSKPEGTASSSGVVTASAAETEVKEQQQQEQVSSSTVSGSPSTTINLQERARQRSQLRQAALLGRGRGRTPRGRGGRGGRGQS